MSAGQREDHPVLQHDTLVVTTWLTESQVVRLILPGSPLIVADHRSAAARPGTIRSRMHYHHATVRQTQRKPVALPRDTHQASKMIPGPAFIVRLDEKHMRVRLPFLGSQMGEQIRWIGRQQWTLIVHSGQQPTRRLACNPPFTTPIGKRIWTLPGLATVGTPEDDESFYIWRIRVHWIAQLPWPKKCVIG